MSEQVRRQERISILLTTEGTYPFHQGGVSTWAHQLIKNMPAVDFTVFSILMNPYVTQKFELPQNAKLIKVPLWGTEEPSEQSAEPFCRDYLAKLRTSKKVIKDRFLPLFRSLVGEIVAVEKTPQIFADTIVKMHNYFREFDYKVSFKSDLVWECYKEIVLETVKKSPSGVWENPDIFCLIQSLGWLYRFFNIVNSPIPKTSLTHSAAAAFCGLPCVIAKELYGTPFLLSEHGIYLREQYLSLANRGYPSFLNTFLIRLIQSVVDVNYAYADQISPVCAYNTRWEKRLTDRPERIEVIHNGVESGVYAGLREVKHARPTVVTVARIDPVKDIINLLQTAALVKGKIHDVKFLIYGAVTVPEYYQQCVEKRKELDLEDTVEFFGHSSNMLQAYESGDVVVQSSISEGFPYAVIEAMMAGKPIISTDVGGVAEALEGVGVMVPPQNSAELAKEIVQMLQEPGTRRVMAEEARERALSMFTLHTSLEKYFKTYLSLALRLKSGVVQAGLAIEISQVVRKMAMQRLFAERGYALLDHGQQEMALGQFSQAVEASPKSGAVPVLSLEMAKIYAQQGKNHLAAAEVQKHRFPKPRRGLRIGRGQLDASKLTRQRQLAEQGYALLDIGQSALALERFREAIKVSPESGAVPVLLLETAKIYAEQGKSQLAENEMVKYRLLMEVQAS